MNSNNGTDNYTCMAEGVHEAFETTLEDWQWDSSYSYTTKVVRKIFRCKKCLKEMKVPDNG